MSQIYRYDSETDTEYYGPAGSEVRVITKDEQREFIKNASEMKTLSADNEKFAELHKKNRERFSDNKTYLSENLIDGFCKHDDHRDRHSLSPHMSYNCLECATEYLYETRKAIRGVDVVIHFINKTVTESAAHQQPSKLEVSISKGVVKIGTIGDAANYYSNFELISNLGDCPILNVYVDNDTLSGYAFGYIVGRMVCKSIMYGEKCYSMTANRPLFTQISVPRGYVNWAENRRNNRKNGDIFIHPCCKGCSDIIQKTKSEKTKQTNLYHSPTYSKSPKSPYRHNNMKIIDEKVQELNNNISELRIELKMQKEQSKNFYISWQNVTIENDKLKMMIKDLKQESALRQFSKHNEPVKHQRYGKSSW